MNVNVETVRELIRKLDLVSDPSQLMADVPLAQQGLDSLDFINLMFRFEEEYGIKLPESEVENVETIDDVVSLVNRKLAERR